MIIRPATLEDAPALIEVLAAMHCESAYAFLPFDRGKVADEIRACVTNPESQCGFVAQCDARIIGVLGGYLGEYFFCRERVASDMVFYVEPSFRGTLVPFRLVRAFREWARARGAAELCLGISTDVHPERTGKFYELMGLKFVGGNYKQRLNENGDRN